MRTDKEMKNVAFETGNLTLEQFPHLGQGPYSLALMQEYEY